MAKDDALANLAKEISVTISSEFITKVSSISNKVKQDIYSFVQSSTKAELEGYELVDTWEDNKYYWVYYRLSKNFYLTNRKEKIEKPIQASLTLFNEARKDEESYNYEKALFYYCKAIEPIKNYISVIPEVDFEGRKALIINEIISSIQNIFGKIVLRSSNTSMNGNIGKPLKEPINIDVITLSPDGEKPLSNIPISFAFVKGKGELSENAHSDSNGKVACQVLLISGTEKEHIIKAELNVSYFLQFNDNADLSKILLSLFTPPSAMIFISVKSPLISVESNESILGVESREKNIEPVIKKLLSDKGFIFVSDISSADYILIIKSDSRKGTETFGLFTSFIDLTFTVRKKDTGEEIYKTIKSNFKGVGTDYEKASLNAYQDISKNVDDIVREVSSRIFSR